MKIFKHILTVIAAIILFTSVISAYEDNRFEMWARNLENKNVLIRKSSAKNLGLLGDKRAIPFLIEALTDMKVEVRVEICKALGLLGDEKVMKNLKTVARKDESADVRKAARRAIREINEYIKVRKEKKLKEIKEKLSLKPSTKKNDSQD